MEAIATGFGTFNLDREVLSFAISYVNLSGAAERPEPVTDDGGGKARTLFARFPPGDQHPLRSSQWPAVAAHLHAPGEKSKADHEGYRILYHHLGGYLTHERKLQIFRETGSIASNLFWEHFNRTLCHMKRKKTVNPRGKGQSERLGTQHKKSGGVEDIFREEARKHDISIGKVATAVLDTLKETYPHMKFRKRSSILKKEIHTKLNSLDNRLGRVLFVKNSNIKPDGGIIEVQDKANNWRIILVSESKHQGNDIEKIKAGEKQGKNKDQDLMVAGNAIERVHKNILEIRNIMINEDYFPYVVFLQGTNFATKTYHIDTPDGRKVKISHDAGSLNRIDRVTTSSYGMDINTNHCKNIEVNNRKLQVASLYFQCYSWSPDIMRKKMLEVAETSLTVLNSNNDVSVTAP
ncbi:MAG: Type-2 restriction enzyme RsrI [Verrucomicrobia subdivision 3 bacterium]|nr:Type-2 restriction enzyme RsrI [Limisphaerales bacterium]MCS1416603.1 Type-2 restriction enzyme RsrI [Limisphaerales bacterium]